MIRLAPLVCLLAVAATAMAQVKVANSNPLEQDFLVNASVAGAIKPVQIFAARNGSFSGKFVLQAEKSFAASASADRKSVV